MTKEIDYYIEADHGFIDGWEGHITGDAGTLFIDGIGTVITVNEWGV